MSKAAMDQFTKCTAIGEISYDTHDFVSLMKFFQAQNKIRIFIVDTILDSVLFRFSSFWCQSELCQVSQINIRQGVIHLVHTHKPNFNAKSVISL